PHCSSGSLTARACAWRTAVSTSLERFLYQGDRLCSSQAYAALAWREATPDRRYALASADQPSDFAAHGGRGEPPRRTELHHRGVERAQAESRRARAPEARQDGELSRAAARQAQHAREGHHQLVAREGVARRGGHGRGQRARDARAGGEQRKLLD